MRVRGVVTRSRDGFGVYLDLRRGANEDEKEGEEGCVQHGVHVFGSVSSRSESDKRRVGREKEWVVGDKTLSGEKIEDSRRG